MCAFVVLGFVFPCQAKRLAWKNVSDLFCVEWDVKPHLSHCIWLTDALTAGQTAVSVVTCPRWTVCACVRYVSTSVSQSDELPCCGTFLLHQGIQRRVALTIVQDGRTELQWTDVHALTVGCVRNTRDWKQAEGEYGILSLNSRVVPCTGQQRQDTRYLPYSLAIHHLWHWMAYNVLMCR